MVSLNFQTKRIHAMPKKTSHLSYTKLLTVKIGTLGVQTVLYLADQVLTDAYILKAG